MKEYTSPVVTGRESSALFNVIAAGPVPPSDILVSAVKYAASKLFGEDFSSLRPDALMPCLES